MPFNCKIAAAPPCNVVLQACLLHPLMIGFLWNLLERNSWFSFSGNRYLGIAPIDSYWVIAMIMKLCPCHINSVYAEYSTQGQIIGDLAWFLFAKQRCHVLMTSKSWFLCMYGQTMTIIFFYIVTLIQRDGAKLLLAHGISGCHLLHTTQQTWINTNTWTCTISDVSEAKDDSVVEHWSLIWQSCHHWL